MTHLNKVLLLCGAIAGVVIILNPTLNVSQADQSLPQGEDTISSNNSVANLTNIASSTQSLETSDTTSDSKSEQLHPSGSLTPHTSASTAHRDYSSKNLAEISLEQAQIDRVYVDKSEQRLYLMQGDTAIKSYHVALGDAPQGHKEQEGDERTPEGEYVLDYKNENSIAYRSIHVSYPNADDIAHAKSLGVSPGGAIMIHGQMNGAEKLTEAMQKFNWTDGCMAVTNEEMDEIMDAVKVGTPIEIEW